MPINKKKLLSIITAFGLVISEFAGFPYVAMADGILNDPKPAAAVSALSDPASETGSDTDTEITQPYTEGDVLICVTSAFDPAAIPAEGAGGITPDGLADIREETLMDVTEAAKEIAEETDPEGAQDGLIAEGDADTETVIRLIHSDTMTTEQLIGYYEGQPGVIFAEPNYIYEIEDETLSAEQEAILSDDEILSAEDVQDTEDAAAETAAGKADIEDAVPDETEASVIIKDETLSADGTPADAPSQDSLLTADETGFEPEGDTDPESYADKQYAFGTTDANGINVPDWNDMSKKNAEGVVVAVLDSGVDYTHPDLAGAMWDEGLDPKYSALAEMGGGKYGINAAYNAEDTTDPADDNGHGTHCAGIIAAEWNDFGVSGAANGAKIMAVKHTFSNRGQNYYSDTIKGMAYIREAKKLGVNVVAVNCSYGGVLASLAEAYAVRELGAAGIVVCHASGNSNINNDHANASSNPDPALSNAIVVNSSDSEGKKSGFSNYGKRNTDVFAPGSVILSTVPVSMPVLIDPERVAKDATDKEARDEFNDSVFYFPYTHMNAEFGTNFGIDSGNFVLRGNLPAEIDEPIDILGFKAPAAFAEIDHPYTLAISSRLNEYSQGEDCNLFLMALAKDKNGDYVRPGKTYVLGENYHTDLYTIDPEYFDVNNLEFKLALYVSGDIQSESYVAVDIDFIRILDAPYVPYDYFSGTSMACPATVGAVAIAAANFPDDSPAKRAARVLASTTPVEDYKNLCVTGGIVNVGNLLKEETYTPVINSVGVERDGLHIEGFFFGEKNNTQVTLKQGDKTWKSETGDFEIIAVNNNEEEGGSEIVTSIPAGFDKGEVMITVTDTGKTEGRQTFERYRPVSDPLDLLSREFIPMNAECPEEFRAFSMQYGTPLNDRLYFVGNDETDLSWPIWCYTPGLPGTFSRVAGPDAETTNLCAWNGKLVYITYGTTEMNIRDPEKGTCSTASLYTGDIVFNRRDTFMLYNAGTDEGKSLLLFRNPYKGTDNDGVNLYANTEVWTADPMLMKAEKLGTLHQSYDFLYKPPIIAYDESRDIYYIAGMDSYHQSMETKLQAEAFKADPDDFDSEELDITPERSSMEISLYEGYCGAALNDGIFLTGCYTLEHTGSGEVPNIKYDNYFISYDDLSKNLDEDTENDVKFTPSTRRICTSKLNKPVTIAYNNRIYCFGINTDTLNIAGFYAPAETGPAYGDEIIYPGTPAQGTDRSVKLKKLSVTPAKVTLTTGEMIKLTATPVFKNAAVTAPVTFFSSTPDIVRVSPDTGELIAADPGTAVVTAYCGNKKAACKVTVKPDMTPYKYCGEETDPDDPISLNKGEVRLLKIKNAYITGSETVKWSSSNKKVVTVNKGLITAKGAGSAIVKAVHKSGKKKTTFTFTVNVENVVVPGKAAGDKKVKLSTPKTSITINSGETKTINVILKGTGFDKRKVKVSTTNKNIMSAYIGEEDVDEGTPVPGTKSGRGTCAITLNGADPGTAYAVVESYDPAAPDAKNRILIKVNVKAPAKDLTVDLPIKYQSSFSGPEEALYLDKGAVLIYDGECDPYLSTDAPKIKWSAKGGAIKVKNGVVKAVARSKKNKKGNQIPSYLTIKAGKRSKKIKIIVR